MPIFRITRTALALATLTLVFTTQAHAATTKTKSKPQSESSNEVVATLDVSSSEQSLIRLQPVAGLSVFQIKVTADQFAKEVNDFYKHSTGVAAGGLIELGRGTFVGQTGLMLIQTGFSGKNEYGKGTATLNYLAVPAVAKVNFSGNPSSSFFLKGGLTPMVFLSGKTKSKDNETGSSTSNDIKGRDIENMDVLATVGGGFAFPMGASTSGVVDISFNRGLVNLTKGSDEPDTIKTKIYNEGFIVSFGTNIAL